MSKEELLKLLDLPVNKIMEVVFYETLIDKEITEDEHVILDGIKAKFGTIRKEYLTDISKLSAQDEIKVEDIERLLSKQKYAFEETIIEAENIARKDSIVTDDEIGIFDALNESVNEIVTEKMEIIKKLKY